MKVFIILASIHCLFLHQQLVHASHECDANICQTYSCPLLLGSTFKSIACVNGLCQCTCTVASINFDVTVPTGTQCVVHIETPCFSKAVTAKHIKGKGNDIPMDEIQVGDEVLTANGNYETIYTIDHRHPTKSSEFIQLHVQEQQQPLELTSRHMVFLKGNPNPVPAHSVKVGNELQVHDETSTGKVVTKIDTITRNGLYSPLTASGTIVVNDGIVASTYSASLSDNEFIEIAGMKIMSHQQFLNMALKPYRYVCTGISLELCKTNNERVLYSQLAHNLYDHWQQEQNSDLYKTIILSSVVLMVFIFNFIFSIYGTMFAVLTLGYFIMKNKSSRIKNRI